MKPLINKDGSINVHDCFYVGDKKLRIIGTEDVHRSGIWNVIDEVKNLDTFKIVKITREKLNKWKPLY